MNDWLGGTDGDGGDGASGDGASGDTAATLLVMVRTDASTVP